MQDYWWKNAVIYGVDVERFCDGNGDGTGDFKGLMSKLPYLTELGVTCIWLLPFFPSTDRDNGYDITDYYRVDPRYGVFDDFLRFVRKCGEQGIRIIIDLVAHHTSSEHPWFQSARCDRTSPFRDFYVWSDHPPPPAPGKASMFPGQEDSVWTFDEVAQSYYYHRFYNFQPGLNHRNPAVLKEIEQVMDFWMSFGISGFRIDAASHMIENPLDPLGEVDKSHSVLRQFYSHVTERMPDAMVLGEVDEDESKLKTFFDGEQLNMMFNFFLDNYLLLALATGDAKPLRDALARLPPPPLNGQWANFLRNLDEADLERLTTHEMNSVLEAFAPKQDMRIYGRGIRRRLAPMLDGRSGTHQDGIQPALRDAGLALPLLRRRNRHGRGPVTGRPQLGAHADAVDRRTQWRFLHRAERPAVAADGRGRPLRLPQDQCRSTAEIRRLAALADRQARQGPPRPSRHRQPRLPRAARRYPTTCWQSPIRPPTRSWSCCTISAGDRQRSTWRSTRCVAASQRC